MNMQAQDTILESSRLSLREMRATDLDDMAEMLGDHEGMQYYPRPKTRDEAQRWIDWNLGLYATRGFGLWAVVLKSTGEFVGDCGLTPQDVDGVEEIEIGYHVKRPYWRRGYAAEAAAECCAYGRERFGLQRLVAIIDPRNVPSQGVAKKLGFELEREVVKADKTSLIFAQPVQPKNDRVR